MANTKSTYSWRQKYMKRTLGKTLRRALIAQRICRVDTSNSYLIKSPYGNKATATLQALAGTYSVTDWTVTDDNLTVSLEAISAEHIFDFESVLMDFDIYMERMDEMVFAVKEKIDTYVLNDVLDGANKSYDNSGVISKTNFPTLLANCIGLVAGYQSYMNKGLFLVLENTDIAAVLEHQFSSGFKFSDVALKNGLMRMEAGVEIYVTRTGTFQTATIGGTSYTNLGHRPFGVKGMTTFAFPRDVNYEEKGVSGKTGKEVFAVGYVGHKTWHVIRDLLVDVDVTT